MPLCKICSQAATGVCGQCKTTHYCSSRCATADWPRHAERCIGGFFRSKWSGVVTAYMTRIFALAEARSTNRKTKEALNALKQQSQDWATIVDTKYKQPLRQTMLEIAELWDDQIQEYNIYRDETDKSRNTKMALFDLDPGTPGSNMVDLLTGTKKNRADIQQAWTWLVECVDSTILARAQDPPVGFLFEQNRCLGGADAIEATFTGKKWIPPS